MKIAFDHFIFTAQQYGGISRYYSAMAKELHRLGQEVKVFGGFYKNNYLQGLPREVVQGYKLNSRFMQPINAFHGVNLLSSQLQMNLWQPDIIHETYYSNASVRNRNAVRITTVYDMIHELFTDDFSPKGSTSSRKYNTLSRVDHILSISHSTKRDLIELFDIEPSKISVVHLGVDLESFKVTDTNQKKVHVGKPYLLYVGARGGYKNFVNFIKAVASSGFLKSNFDIIAFGGGAFNEYELSCLQKFGYRKEQVIQITGDDSILSNLYRSATALVYPSLYEGFGLPPLEAMASGCPVISSNTSSMPEVIGEAGEYFNPYDIDDIRYAIERVVLSSELTQRLIKEGYCNSELFSWEKCTEQTLHVYQGLVGG